MTQTVINIGNSQGLILPKEVLDKLGIKKGSKVNMEINDGMISITRAGVKRAKPNITPEFVEWLESFNKRYKNALQELASK